MTMSTRWTLFCLCLLLSLQTSHVNAQQTQAPREVRPDEGQTSVESDSGISIPEPLGGFSQQLASYPDTGRERANLLMGSIGVSALYMDTAFSPRVKSIHDFQFLVIPGIGWQSFSPRTQLLLNYAGGFVFDESAPRNSQQTQGGAADLRHRFTQRLVSEIRQDYVFTNSPFTQAGVNQPLPVPAGPGELSSFALPSNATRIESISSASLTYQLSRHSGWGASGTFSSQKFRDVSVRSGVSGSLIDTQMAAGRTFFLTQVSAHHDIGMQYQLQDLKFAEGLARTADQTLFLFDGISFKSNMKLSLYAGPQFTHTHNVLLLSPAFTGIIVPVLRDELSVAGGAAYTWQGNGAGFRLSGGRGVSDGGGFMGAVRLNTGTMELEKNIASHWKGTLQLVYSDGRLIGLPAKNASSRVTTGEGLLGLTRWLTPNVSVTGQYARIQQPRAGTLTARVPRSSNRAEVTLTYQFQKALTQ